ncbi:hypothetical protein O9K51_02374 [Purpureocillium lavendulum]|uniref:Uncharacterized protein n=1 Tax=Purpureocillium lavendulum TaxID=1247861 RepID=A0AB34FXA3_9HYPO|nr:hypothetical protein O9K51_02374 [Purpureocillium lavendulum]
MRKERSWVPFMSADSDASTFRAFDRGGSESQGQYWLQVPGHGSAAGRQLASMTTYSYYVDMHIGAHEQRDEATGHDPEDG